MSGAALALIGMPGCGKSTVGRELSRLTGMELADTDEIISARAGMSISDIFRLHGEEYFRRLESGLLSSLTLRRGIIIACGGGAVLSPVNRDYLSRCTCLYLRRDTADLPADGRPLSLSVGAAALERERAPLYAMCADREYFNRDCLDTARRIKDELGL